LLAVPGIPVGSGGGGGTAGGNGECGARGAMPEAERVDCGPSCGAVGGTGEDGL